jgi:hypothetical protein
VLGRSQHTRLPFAEPGAPASAQRRTGGPCWSCPGAGWGWAVWVPGSAGERRGSRAMRSTARTPLRGQRYRVPLLRSEVAMRECVIITATNGAAT